MAKFELKLPKMGESVAEATITSWLKEVGDTIELDEAIVEIATDKVDSEIPSEVKGILKEKLFEVDAIVKVGQTIAIIEIESLDIDENDGVIRASDVITIDEDKTPDEITTIEKSTEMIYEMVGEMIDETEKQSLGKFYSPLVKNIAKEEGISFKELDSISGTGKENRVTKIDILNYIKTKENNGQIPETSETDAVNLEETPITKVASATTVSPVSVNGNDEIIEMTRMGKLIAKRMVASTQTSPHVQSFIEVDFTNFYTCRTQIHYNYIE